MNQVFFHPTFGSRPARIIGRDQEVTTFLDGLAGPVGGRDRCMLILGQRGMGKTTLLLELEDQARQRDFVVARVSHNEEMLDEIIELIQINGARFVKERKQKVKGFSVGALGFSAGLTFSEETRQNFGFRVKLSLLCDKLAENGKGVLILVDETKTSEKMRQLATTYQHLAGEGKNIAICMAGLPHAVSSVLNDDVLTFLNRARKMRLGLISRVAVRAYFEEAFSQLGVELGSEEVRQAAELTQGFPYFVQLIGYYIVQFSQGGTAAERVLALAREAAYDDLGENVFVPLLAVLSDRDVDVLEAMAHDEGPSSTADLCTRLGVTDSYFQTYRRRLIDAGVVEAPRRGELAFAVPLLAEYLQGEIPSSR